MYCCSLSQEIMYCCKCRRDHWVTGGSNMVFLPKNFLKISSICWCSLTLNFGSTTDFEISSCRSCVKALPCTLDGRQKLPLFLHGDLDESVYMKLLPRYFLLVIYDSLLARGKCSLNNPSMGICKLLKFLYWLKKAPKPCFAKFSDVLQSHYFVQSKANCTFFFIKHTQGVFFGMQFFLDQVRKTDKQIHYFVFVKIIRLPFLLPFDNWFLQSVSTLKASYNTFLKKYFRYILYQITNNNCTYHFCYPIRKAN